MQYGPLLRRYDRIAEWQDGSSHLLTKFVALPRIAITSSGPASCSASRIAERRSPPSITSVVKPSRRTAARAPLMS
jgi:hypothetical protein